MIPDEHKQAHEVQLIGWGESMKSGPYIRLRVTQEAYEYFKQFNAEGKNQQRFHLVAVPIDDNEEPLRTEPKKRFEELSRAQQAGILCHNPRFQTWLRNTYPQSSAEVGHIAADTVRKIFCLDSRRGLNDPEIAKSWDGFVRRYREETQLPEQRG